MCRGKESDDEIRAAIKDWKRDVNGKVRMTTMDGLRKRTVSWCGHHIELLLVWSVLCTTAR